MWQVLSVLCGGLLCVACESSGTAGPSAPRERAPIQMQSQIDALEGMSKPGPAHAKLASLVGHWQLSSVQVAADGSEASMPLEGSAQLEWMLEGRYLRWDSQSLINGRRFRTHGWLGFDNRAGEYQLSMITSVSSGMGIWHGSGDPTRDGVTFLLEQVDPLSGTRLRARNRLRILKPDLFITEDLNAEGLAVQRTYYRRDPTR